MCPACIANVPLMAASASSTGGLSAFAVKRLSRKSKRNHHMYGKGGEVDKSLVASWYQRIGQISSVTALSKIFVDIQADLLRYIGRRRVASAPHPQIHIMMRLA